MTSPGPAQIEAAWNRFCDELKQAGRALNRTTTPDDAVTLAEGLRYLTRLTRIGLESALEFADPKCPAINRLVTETRKFGCDNPDTIYQTAVLEGGGRYRIRGERGSVSYLSFLTTAGADGRMVRTGFIDSSTLTVDANGEFEIALGGEPAPGNWLPMTPATDALSIRQTFLDRRREAPAQLAIERLDGAAVPEIADPATVEARLEKAAGFVNYCARQFTDWSESYLPHTNDLPAADQAVLIAAGLDPNIFFFRSCWRVAPDEALVIHLPRLPDCEGWNLQVDNYWQESMDYRYFRSHINKHTAHRNGDGSITAVVAQRDPGHPNWLDTAGHTVGHLGMRYIRLAPGEEKIEPVTRLCAFDRLPATIAALEQR